jgi:hypothetical protein
MNTFVALFGSLHNHVPVSVMGFLQPAVTYRCQKLKKFGSSDATCVQCFKSPFLTQGSLLAQAP